MGEVPNEPDATQNYETDVELLLAASNAIQQMVAERQVLRERVMTLEHELQALRSQAILVNDSYRTEHFVTAAFTSTTSKTPPCPPDPAP